MPEVTIREATDADGEALADLLATQWSAYPGCAFDADEALRETPASRFEGEGGKLWLVVADGAPAGSLGVSRHARDGEFQLSLICLAPEMRGQGLATALVAGAHAFAAASGGSRLNAWIDTRLTDGVAFLERRGFVRDPGVRQRHDGSDALDAHYSRDVAPEVEAQLVDSAPEA